MGKMKMEGKGIKRKRRAEKEAFKMPNLGLGRRLISSASVRN